ncbi:tigger transposable element-derived protein 1-like [Mauremys reevesii]|uniref:tigger transposable element-derived protein 1-like n=1 Tax=Mauremys reevesii TaxID=260615 RepID=UPI00193EDB20|nr:tigger transposable element-derived protein 1-like [Mauremys reevesii]
MENIDALWEEVTVQWMNGVWRCAWPDAAHSFVGFDAVLALEQEIVRLAKDVGFEEEDVQELLESHAEQLTNERLIELDQQWISEERKDNDGDDIRQEARSLTKNLSCSLGLLDEMMEIIENSDPFCEQSAKVSRTLDAVACYREIYRSKIHEGEQTSAKSFLKSSVKKPATENPATTPP